MALPALAVSVSWIRLEDPRLTSDLAFVVLLAVAPALARAGAMRLAAFALAIAAMAWITLGAEVWELAPFRDEHVVSPVSEKVWRGIGEYYDVLLPFNPALHPEMHALMLVAVFGFVAAIAWLVAARRPLAAAGVTIAGAGWPATLLADGAVFIGALALAAALSITVVLRARSLRALAAGGAVAALVVGCAAWASSATSFTREAVLDWQHWDLGSPGRSGLNVRFVWDAQYDGIAFPPSATTVLRISGPNRAQYWRVSTLDAFIADRWFEDLSFVVTSGPAKGPLRLGALAPRVAHDEKQWVEQQVEVRALAEDRLVAAGTPVAVDAPSLGTVFAFAGGVVRAQGVISLGTRYRVWSYVPDPAPAALAAAPVAYPPATRPYLTLWGRTLPRYGTAHRDERVSALLDDPSYADLGAYRPLYEDAMRVTQGATSPYAAVLALESWLRQRGGFRYSERPPVTHGRPLIDFVESTRAGYCQHFAGAMALMARLLGIPARVAVGFTSGRLENGGWTVTDHDAHAWVEVWFPGYGWIPFDPTPGRGTFSTQYSFASNSSATVAKLRRGALDTVAADRNPGDLEGFGSAESGGADRPSILAIAMVLAALGAAAIGVVKWMRRRLRYLTTDPRRAAAATRAELEAFLRDQGVAVPRSATLDDLKTAVADELGFDASAYVAAAGRARFGDPQDAPHAARAARAELAALLRSVRERLPLPARLRGFVSLRSLRGWQG